MRCPLMAPVLIVASLLALPAAAQKNFDTPPQMDGPSSSGSAPSRRPSARSSDNNTRFTLINSTDMIIDTLNISPVADSEWGDDLLGTLSLPARSRLIAGPSQDTGCMFDVRVVYHDRREEILRRQNLCDATEIAFTGRTARRVQRRSE